MLRLSKQLILCGDVYYDIHDMEGFQMKKTTVALLALMLSASIFSVNHIHAEAANQPFVIEGKVVTLQSAL